jgi:hypothetical protein
MESRKLSPTHNFYLHRYTTSFIVTQPILHAYTIIPPCLHNRAPKYRLNNYSPRTRARSTTGYLEGLSGEAVAAGYDVSRIRLGGLISHASGGV